MSHTEIPQINHTSTNLVWDNYLNWDSPGLTYQPDTLVWFPGEGAITDQPLFYADTQLSTIDAVNGLLEIKCGEVYNAGFCGLQEWYSTVSQDLLLLSPTSTIRQLASFELQKTCHTHTLSCIGAASHIYSRISMRSQINPSTSSKDSSTNSSCFTQSPRC